MKTVVVYSLVRFRADTEKLELELSITLPHIDVTADYDVEGRILLAPINSRGVFKGNFSKCRFERAAVQSVPCRRKTLDAYHYHSLTQAHCFDVIPSHYYSLVVIDTVMFGTCLPSFQGKVKFTVEQATKALMGCRGIALFSL